MLVSHHSFWLVLCGRANTASFCSKASIFYHLFIDLYVTGVNLEVLLWLTVQVSKILSNFFSEVKNVQYSDGFIMEKHLFVNWRATYSSRLCQETDALNVTNKEFYFMT